MTHAPDVLVIGGGVIGLTCAWRLAQRKLRVTLVERGRCGDGASGAALGALIPAPPTRTTPLPLLHRRSLSLFPDFAAELHERSGVDVRYERCGRLERVQTPQRLETARREIEAARSLVRPGEPPELELLPPDEVSRLAPHFAGSEYGAILCRATARVDTAALLVSLKKACTRAGADIREHHPVRSVEVVGGRVSAVVCEQAKFAPGAVLACAGAWMSQLGAPLASVAPVAPVRGQAVEMQSSRPPSRRLLRSKEAFAIFHDDGRVVVGSTTEPNAGFNARPTASGVANLSSAAMHLVPPLAEASVTRVWAGLRPRTPDRKPFIGAASGVDGLYIAGGHYKLGLGLAPLTARWIADLIADGVSADEASAFRPGRSPDANSTAKR